MDDFQNNYVECKEPDIKENALCGSSNIKFSKMKILSNKQLISGCLGQG